MKALLNDWRLLLLLSLTLGLAPFVPEPHLFGKIRWIAGGAHGMEAMDWFDFVMHATPWVLLLRYLMVRFLFRNKPSAAK
jgi:hypothetical protein